MLLLLNLSCCRLLIVSTTAALCCCWFVNVRNLTIQYSQSSLSSNWQAVLRAWHEDTGMYTIGYSHGNKQQHLASIDFEWVQVSQHCVIASIHSKSKLRTVLLVCNSCHTVKACAFAYVRHSSMLANTCLHYCLYRMSGLGCAAGLLLAVCTSICTLLLIAVALMSAVAALTLMAVALLVVSPQCWRVNSGKWSARLAVGRR
jgi:hypothetical protein